jgi:sugar/nucleoside kinase (ribokinase family)
VRDPTVETGIALVQVGDNGEKQILAVPGANARLSIEDVRAARTTIDDEAVTISHVANDVRDLGLGPTLAPLVQHDQWPRER